MTVRECPLHHLPMEIVPSEPRSRCPQCGYATARVRFENCPQCRRPMVIEEPEPHWHCPSCVPTEEEPEPSPAR